jgi:hypothetical protein
MSALGQKQTYALQKAMSALPLRATEIADIMGFRMRGRTTLLRPCNYLGVTEQKLHGAQIAGR